MNLQLSKHLFTLKDSLFVRDFVEIEKINKKKESGEITTDTELSILVAVHLTTHLDNEIVDKDQIKAIIEELTIDDFKQLSNAIAQVISPESLKKNSKTQNTPTDQ